MLVFVCFFIRPFHCINNLFQFTALCLHLFLKKEERQEGQRLTGRGRAKTQAAGFPTLMGTRRGTSWSETRTS